MYRKIFITTLFYILFNPLNLFAINLKWDIDLQSKLEFVYDANVEYYENGSLKKIFNERNIIDLLCYNKNNKGQAVNGTFSIYRKNNNEIIYRLEEQYNSDFFINKKGIFDVPKNTFMPNLRHLPTFPDYDIQEGSVWKAPVHIVFNNFSIPLTLLLESQYTVLFINQQTQEAFINYSILIDKSLLEKNYPEDIPLKLYGQYSGQMVWDIQKNQPKRSINSYNILMIFGRSGTLSTIEFKMSINQTNMAYKNIPQAEKEQQQKELEASLAQEGVSIDSDSRGFIVRFSDILFEFDKYNLNNDALNILDKLVKIIKTKYPNNEIIIEGHTDNIGTDEYNLQLSEKRAYSVAMYLKNKLGHDKISYRGLGKAKPIDDNATSVGRQKNRRVEVIIKM